MRVRRSLPPDNELGEFAALADGSLAGERRTDLERRVAESPELASLLAEQERAVAIVHRAAAEVDAPDGLRKRIELQRSGRAAGVRRRPMLLAAGMATAAAVVALVVVLSLPSGAGGPSAAEAAVFATLPATAPAPAADPARPTLLRRKLEGVPFPNFAQRFGLQAAGSRADMLDGRQTSTVLYERAGNRIGYTIVSGRPLHVPRNADNVRVAGTELRTFREHGRLIVTWLRKGHTCVLSGSGITRDAMLKLASWKGRGTIPF